MVPASRVAHDGAMRSVVWRVFAGSVWRQTVLLVSSGVLGAVWFTWVVTLMSLGLGLAVTLLGLPLLAVTVRSGWLIGAAERARVLGLSGVDIPAPATPVRPPGLLPWLRTSLADTVGWKGLAYGMVMLPWGVSTLTIAVTMWSAGLGLFTVPLWDWAVPDGAITSVGSYEFTGWGRVGVLAGGVVVGLLLLLVTPPVVGLLARGQVALVRSLLGADRRAVLERRVDELQTSRSASVDLAEAERRRIERDLHDGTQQRLVGLAIDLGIARERLADGSDDRSRELVERAHEGVKEAIAELRDLVRGIHPAVLTDRGLDAAVSALAARSPIAVEVRSDLQRRLPAVVESAAYFTVAEALTNAMKHSRATLVTVSVHDDGTALTLEVVDDGVGGAHLGPTGGLQGLDDRLRALEARLEVSSPPGGPTTVKAVIPCGW